MDHFLLALMQGGLLGARLRLEGGHSMAQLPVPPPYHPGASRQLCLARGMESLGYLGAAGGAPLFPASCRGLCLSLSPNLPPSGGFGAGSAAGGRKLGTPGWAGRSPRPRLPAGFIYKQAGAGTGQPGTTGTRRPIMLIITT